MDEQINLLELANNLHAVIKHIIKPALCNKNIKFDQNDNRELIKKITQQLDKLESQYKENQLSDTPYISYFLNTISKFNNYFYPDISINGKDDNSQRETLFLLGLRPIDHAWISSTNKKIIKLTQQKNNKVYFREPYKYKFLSRIFYFYHKKRYTYLPHQDLCRYVLDNIMMYLHSMKSNLLYLLGKLFKLERWLDYAYFRASDYHKHQHEKELFRSGKITLKNSNTLTKSQLDLFSKGNYYRYQLPLPIICNHEQYDTNILHIGHASILLYFGGINIATDSTHYHPGAGEGKFISIPGKIFYGRKTLPALSISEYPNINIVWISHNHYDHLCKQSLIEAFDHTRTVFIVPIGDKRTLEKWGLKNIIEIGSWNEQIDIQLCNDEGEIIDDIKLFAYPANHASNRGTFDLYQSLYMGCIFLHKKTGAVTLISGDSAKLDKEHFDQLREFLLNHNYQIKTLCLACGPDRPRRWSKLTHQSSADTLPYLGKVHMFNLEVFLKRKQKTDISMTVDELSDTCPDLYCYHHSCFRLGQLHYHDVRKTLLHMLAVLDSYAKCSVPLYQVAETLQDNFYFYTLDQFEKDALLELLNIYTLNVFDNESRKIRPLTSKEILDILTKHIIYPFPGFIYHASENNEKPTFPMDYKKIILNQNPVYHNHQLEHFARHLEPDLYYPDVLSAKLLIYRIFSIYENMASKRQAFLIKKVLGKLKDEIKDFDKTYASDSSSKLHCLEKQKLFVTIYQKIIGKKKTANHVRIDDLFYTTMLILVNIIYQSSFREQFYEEYKATIKSTNPS